MRTTILTLVLVVGVAGWVSAQDSAGSIGIYFEPESFTCEDAHISVGAYEIFQGYLTITDSYLSSIAGYEAGLSLLPELMNVSYPMGSLNFGDFHNQLVGFQDPLPLIDGARVVATLHLYCGEVTDYFPVIGPSDPASIPGSPVVADGTNPDYLLALEPMQCSWWPGYWGTAWIEAQVVATENRSLSTIKQLFR